MEIRKAWVTIAATDLERSTEFYQRLLSRDPVIQVPEVYVEFEISGLRLGIYKPRPNEREPKTVDLFPAVSLCVQVEKLDAAIEDLTLLGASIGEIIPASHGRELYAYDPDGNRIILYQPV